MAGLVPAIHVFLVATEVDARNRSRHGGVGRSSGSGTRPRRSRAQRSMKRSGMMRCRPGIGRSFFRTTGHAITCSASCVLRGPHPMTSIEPPEIAALVRPGRVHRRVYTDPALFNLEMEKIFGSAWIYVGHESQVKNP